MRLTGQSVERQGDKVVIKANLTNKWHHKAFFKIVEGEVDDPTLIEGDVKETIGLLNAIAEIAWNNGWRPSGLGETINAVVMRHKIPKG